MSNIYKAVHQFQRLGMRLEWSAGHRPRTPRQRNAKCYVCSCMVNLRIQGLEAQGLHHLPLLLSPRRVLYCEKNRVCLSQEPSEQAEQSCCQQHPMKISPPTDISYSQI